MTERKFQRKLEKIKKQGERYKKEYELKEAYAKYVPDKKKRKVSNIMIVITVFAITIYTIANFWLTYSTGVGMDATLTTCFYAFWTSEIFVLAGIRVSKVIRPEDSVEQSIYTGVETEGDYEFMLPDEEMCEEEV